MLKLKVIAALAVALALLAGCDPNAEGGAPPTRPNPPAGGGQHNPGGGTGTQPAPVQRDPSAHNTQAGEVDLHVEWSSENNNTPVCEWSKNGVSQPCANMARGEHPNPDSLDYIGFWEHGEMGQVGDVFTVNAQGTGAVKTIDCSIAFKGRYHPGVTNGRRCGATFTVT